MVVLQRRQLRQDLGIRRLRQTLVGTTSTSLGANASFVMLDSFRSNYDFSGQGLYNRAWIRVASADYQVGTYNAGSGAFLSGQLTLNAIASGALYELHERLNAAEMDAAIDETILGIVVRREVGIRSIDGALFYTLDGAASPNTIKTVLNTYYFANPSGSLNRDRREFVPKPQFVATPTGNELRLTPGQALGASYQIVLDAILELSLPAGDTATINLPHEEVVLWGAAARCYDLIIQRSPGQEAGLYEKRRSDAVRMFNRLAPRDMPEIVKPITFETPLASNVLADWL